VGLQPQHLLLLPSSCNRPAVLGQPKGSLLLSFTFAFDSLAYDQSKGKSKGRVTNKG